MPSFTQKTLPAVALVAVIALAACAAPAARAPAQPTLPAQRPTAMGPGSNASSVSYAATAAPEAALPPAAAEAPAMPVPSQPTGGVTPRPIVAGGQNDRIPIEPTSVANKPIATPADTTFHDYGVNPFVDTTRDHLSTFALDVDTASYAIARRYIMNGLLPPFEAVRAEEFVNYFVQDYAVPRVDTFAIYADGALSPFHHDGLYLLRIGVQGYDVPESERKPASLTFVIDVSGSMDMENRLGLVKRSLQLLVERLRPDDSVSIVVFGDTARVVLYPTSGANKDAILSAIYGLQSEGSTNTEAGLQLGYEMAAQAYLPGGINRVILCSDGVGNVGTTDPIALINGVKGRAPSDVMLTRLVGAKPISGRARRRRWSVARVGLS